MELVRSSEGSGMDRLVAIGSPLSPWPAHALDSPGAGPNQGSRWIQATEPNSDAPLDSASSKDTAAEQQRTLHFLSHVDAECFISLLQTMDPMPDDYRARAEYKRFYRQLQGTLEVPLPPPDPRPLEPSSDPLR